MSQTTDWAFSLSARNRVHAYSAAWVRKPIRRTGGIGYYALLWLILLLFIQPILTQDCFALAQTPSPSGHNTSSEAYDKLIEKLFLEKTSLAEESRRQFDTIKDIFEKERAALGNIFDKIVWLVGAASAVVIFLLYVIYGDQKNIHQKIKEDNDEELTKIREQNNNARERLLAEVAKLDLLKDQLANKEKEISSFLDEQNRYKNKIILWVYAESHGDDSSIISSLKQKNIEHIYEEVLNAETPPPRQRCDVIIFSIQCKENILLVLFKDLLDKLQSDGEPPLVIYTYNSGRQIHLESEQWSVLDAYNNYTVANFPGSLQATLNNILRWQ